MLTPRPDDSATAIAPLVALEAPWSREFDSALTERRRLFSEFLGTFLLVLVGVRRPYLAVQRLDPLVSGPPVEGEAVPVHPLLCSPLGNR